MNKKGLTYLLTVSLITVVLLGIFLSQQDFAFQQAQRVEGSKIYAMNDFIKDINSDMERVMEIGSYRAFIAMEDYISIREDFLDDVEETMLEVFTQGTIDGASALLMNDSSLDYYFESVNNLMNRRGINVDYNVLDLSLQHKTPWDVEMTVMLNILVFDVENTANWNYTQNFSSTISVLNLRDPLYSVKTSGNVPNTIIPQNQSFNSLNILEDHIQNSHYIPAEEAPSFLQRFENNLSGSEFGIESIINVWELDAQNIFVHQERVKIDYIYFNDLLVGDVACDFSGLDSTLHLVLPQINLERYGLNETSHETNC